MIQEKIKSRLQPLILPCILVLSGVLRLMHLGFRDFWYDEAFTGITIRSNFSTMMGIIYKDIHPPLYYIGAKVFSSFFHYSVFGIRLYSVLFGVLSVWAVYLFARELSGRKAAWFAAFIAAIAPFAVQYSQEARMYTQYAFFLVMAGYFLLRALKTERIKYYLLWGLFLGFSILTHYMSVVFIPFFILVAFIWKNEPVQNLWKTMFWARFKKLSAGLLVFVVMFLPWLPKALVHWHNSKLGLNWVYPAHFNELMYAIQAFFLGMPAGNTTQGQISPTNQIYTIPGLYAGIIFVILLTVIIIYSVIRNRRKAVFLSILVLGVPIFLFVLSSFGLKYFVSRYFMPNAYFLYILLGLVLARFKFRFSISILVAYILLMQVIYPVPASNEWNSLKRDLSTYNNYTFYVLNPFEYVLAKYYIGEDRLILFNAEDPGSRPVSWAAIGDSLKSTDQASDLYTNSNSVVLTYSHLDQNPLVSLHSVQFKLLRIYHHLYVFKASPVQPGE